MELFDVVFNKPSIYEMLFFSTKAVLEYPTLDDLKEKNPVLYERWEYLANSKYGANMVNSGEFALQAIYQNKAIYYPEFSRIVAITYATVEVENGTLKRYLKKISNEDEYLVLANFMDVLHQFSTDGVNSSPQYFPMLCGHNILNYDIPLLIKRYLKHRNNFENKNLPLILKRCLGAKPWESKVIDTVNVWKLNGNDYTPLMLIADYLGLKKTVDLLALPELSNYYWNYAIDKPEETLEYVSLQSATQTNLIIQLMNELRQI